jgi:hypothetical protein
MRYEASEVFGNSLIRTERCTWPHVNRAMHSTDMAGHTFVPRRLSQNLITCCHVPGDVFSLVILLDSAVVILSVAFEPVKGSNPHLIFEALNVDAGHGVERRRDAPA